MNALCHLFGRSVMTACLLAASAVASAQTFADGYLGEPLGVGRVTVVTADFKSLDDFAVRRVRITEENNRVFYPVVSTGPVRELIGKAIGGGEKPLAVTVFFLFEGHRPLDVAVHIGDRKYPARIRPAGRPLLYPLRMTNWWRDYHVAALRRKTEGDTPPLVDAYLTTMLAKRYGKAPPLFTQILDSPPPEPLRTLQLLAGVESLRAACCSGDYWKRDRPAERSCRCLGRSPGRPARSSRQRTSPSNRSRNTFPRSASICGSAASATPLGWATY